MKKAVPILYASYGRYTDEFRAIPSINDCLKPVERRSLYALHEEAPTKFVKSAKVVGSIIAKYHAHGDACIRQYHEIYDPIQKKIFQLKDLVENDLTINCLSWDDKTNSIKIGRAHNFRIGQKDVNKYLRIYFQNHDYIDVTPNHQFLVHEDVNHDIFKRADELKLYDNICGLEVIYNYNKIQLDPSHITVENNFCRFKTHQILTEILNNITPSTELFDDILYTITDTFLYILNNYPNINIHLISNDQFEDIYIKRQWNLKELYKYRANNNINKYIDLFSKIPFKYATIISNIEELSLYPVTENFIDFTVDEYQNLFIITNYNNKDLNMICVHNSTYDTVVNLVNRGFGIGQGNFGHIAVKPVPPAAYRYCVTGNALIKTKDYGEIEISKLNFINDNPILVAGINSEKWVKATKWFEMEETDFIYTIKTNKNKKLSGNDKHPILCKVNKEIKWKLLKEIKNGDQVIIYENNKFHIEIITNIIIKKLNNIKVKIYSLRIDSDDHAYISNGFISHNTECKINPSIDKLAFDYIKYAPYSDPEGLETLQPNYIPSPISIGLIGEGMITGISFNITKIPRYKIEDLFNRLTNIFQRQFNPDIPPYTIIPNFLNFDVYEETTGECEKILTTGTGTLILIPKYKIDGYGIHVYGRPPTGCSSWLKEDTDDNKIKYTCDDLSGSQGFEALFSPKNGARLEQSWINMILELIKVKINFVCNVWDNKVVTKGIDELLLKSYTNWSNCLQLHLYDKKSKISEKLREMLIIEVIRYFLNGNIGKITTIDDLCNIFEQNKNNIPSQFAQDITSNEIKSVCKKHSIQKLFDYHIDKQSNLNELNNIDLLLSKFNEYAYDIAKQYLNK